MATSSIKQGNAQWKKIQVPLIKLHLDLENFRHEPVATEEEAIAKLYKPEKVEAMARHIADTQALSPLDVVGVVPMDGNPGHYVAVEGNRRVCALLLLNDPERAPSVEAKSLMRSLAGQFQLPAAIEVVKFKDKSTAKPWIDLRHQGAQEGQGLRPWDATQKERAADAGGANSLAVEVLDRARAGQWLDTDQLPAVTTLTRYLKNREVRAALGLGHHKKLVFTYDQAEVDQALAQFLQDAIAPASGGTPPVNSRSKAADWTSYARDFRVRGHSPTTPLPKPSEPTPPITPPTSKRGGPRNRPNPALRKCLVPQGFVCNLNNKNLRMLFKEMQRTPIEDHEFANSFLLRAFAEQVMTLYIKKVQPSFNWRDQQQLVNKCSEALDPTASLAKFKALRTAASSLDASHSLHSLGAAVHSGILMDRRALISAWANWEKALQAMLDQLTTN